MFPDAKSLIPFFLRDDISLTQTWLENQPFSPINLPSKSTFCGGFLSHAWLAKGILLYLNQFLTKNPLCSLPRNPGQTTTSERSHMTLIV